MPPQTVGHYAIEHELGHGQNGAVYLARDMRLDRRVATCRCLSGTVSVLSGKACAFQQVCDFPGAELSIVHESTSMPDTKVSNFAVNAK